MSDPQFEWPDETCDGTCVGGREWKGLYWAENERMRALYEAVAQWANAMNRDDCRASEINLFNVYDSVKDGDA